MLRDLVIRNRSCRGYDRSRPVTTEELRSMVDLARQAAAGMNVQPMKYYLITDPEEAALVNSLTVLGAHLRELHLPFPGTEPPAYILICQDHEVHPDDSWFITDVGFDAQTITLAATEMGLAGCMIGNFSDKKLREALGISDRYTVQLVIAIGKSAEEIKIVEVDEGADMHYYRKDGVHYVPKRKLDDIIIHQ